MSEPDARGPAGKSPAGPPAPGLVVRVDDGVALTAADQPPVHRCRHQERQRQRTGERHPEQGTRDTGVDGARDDQHGRVVDDLHHDDRDRVRGQSDLQRGSHIDAGPENAAHRQRIAEHERERDGQHHRAERVEAETAADDHPEYFTDRAARQAVQRRLRRHLPGRAVMLVVRMFV